MIVSVQLLRAVAALMVFWCHYSKGKDVPLSNVGWSGVDVFFILSGFVIAYIILKDTNKFLLKRVIRIIPLYYIATFGMIALSLLSLYPQIINAETILKSLFFIPYTSPSPIVPIGWTLNYEMLFYMIAFLCILLVKNKKYIILTLSIVLIMLTITLISVETESAIISFYNEGLFAEFLFGIIVYLIYSSYKKSRVSTKFEFVKYLFLLLSFIVVIVFELDMIVVSKYRFIQNGLPALFLVIFFLSLEKHINPDNKFIKFAILAGDASFSMYLFHSYFYKITDKIPLSVIIIAPLTILFGIFGSILIYLFLDKPIQNFLRNKFLK